MTLYETIPKRVEAFIWDGSNHTQAADFFKKAGNDFQDKFCFLNGDLLLQWATSAGVKVEKGHYVYTEDHVRYYTTDPVKFRANY